MRHESVKIMQDAAKATGNGVSIGVSGFGVVSIQVSGTFVGTVTFEGTVDNESWFVVQAKNKGTATTGTTATAAGIYDIDVTGLQFVRARISAYTSGTITAKAKCSEALPTGAASTINATVDNVKVTDSTGANKWVIDSAGAGKVAINGSIDELYSMNIADRPAYATITKPTSFTLLNATMDTWVTDGSADWVVI
jgi:hypothetical protein